MNKKHFSGLLTMAGLALVLSSCQIAPVNATTSITNAAGAGTKTISMLVLVDGSCQIEPNADLMLGNSDYWYFEDVDFSDITITPKADGAKVKLYHDGYLTNPNGKATVQEVWDEFNDVVESYVPEGFEFKCTEVKSSDWNDDYMTTVPDATVNAWKGYVYSVTYSWTSVEDYVTKTKTLIGESYAESHLQELDDAGTPWATLTKNDDGTSTWTEAYLVNYWSVYGVADKVLSSEYFNKAALGDAYAITTDNAFSVALQEFKIGESESVFVKIDNKNGLNADLSPKFISATGVIPEPKSNTGLIVGIVAGVVVVAAAVVAFVVLRKKK